jgi:hypothetical protein
MRIVGSGNYSRLSMLIPIHRIWKLLDAIGCVVASNPNDFQRHEDCRGPGIHRGRYRFDARRIRGGHREEAEAFWVTALHVKLEITVSFG